MALFPYSNMSRETLQPGARGELFTNSGIPGHRTDDQRINRSNNTLKLSEHDVLNVKYALDPRLPKLFRYGWAYGYNQIVMPKGRLVAADPHLMVMDTDTNHFHNALTLANGGEDVELDLTTAVPSWKKATAPFVIDQATGKDTNKPLEKRPANKCVGILERNEYSRDTDAFNGIMVGPIRTDAIVELPWFVDATKANKNPWGSIIGNAKPGDLVKPDVDGRAIISPLSNPTWLADETRTMAEIEKERQQVIGQVLATDTELVPEGAAKYAQWALDDRRNFQDFNPYVWPNTNRAGEDFVTNPPTAYQSNFDYPGYPYDKTYISNDLHMLSSRREGAYDPRFDEAHRMDRGIPGLTDGYNAHSEEYGKGETLTVTVINDSAELNPDEIIVRLPDTNLESAKVKLVEIGGAELTAVSIVAGATIGNFDVTYADVHKGLFALRQKVAGDGKKYEVKISYVKRGMAGVPTNLDWDGIRGTCSILLNL